MRAKPSPAQRCERRGAPASAASSRMRFDSDLEPGSLRKESDRREQEACGACSATLTPHRAERDTPRRSAHRTTPSIFLMGCSVRLSARQRQGASPHSQAAVSEVPLRLPAAGRCRTCVRRRGGGDDGHAAGGSARRGRGRRANGRPASSRAQPSGGQLLNQLHVAAYVSGGSVGLATRGRERRRSGEATQKDDDVPSAVSAECRR